MLLNKIGLKIKEERKRLGYSQENFALKIGMDRTYYSGVENGKYNISIMNLKKITDGLGIKIGDLFKGI